MASARERRQQKAREKQKKRRAEAQVQRKDKSRRGRTNTQQAAAWPVSGAYVSEGWFAWESTVHAVIDRVHGDGTHAWAAFVVDLADQRLVSAESWVGGTEGNVQATLVEHADEEALVSVEPEVVAHLVVEAIRRSRAEGHELPDGLEDARVLLGDLRADDSPFDFHWGYEDDDEDTVEVKRGIVARLRALFGG